MIDDTLRRPSAKATGKLDLNNACRGALADRLRDPLLQAGVALSEQELQDLVKAMTNFRDTPPRSGLITQLRRACRACRA